MELICGRKTEYSGVPLLLPNRTLAPKRPPQRAHGSKALWLIKRKYYVVSYAIRSDAVERVNTSDVLLRVNDVF